MADKWNRQPGFKTNPIGSLKCLGLRDGDDFSQCRRLFGRKVSRHPGPFGAWLTAPVWAVGNYAR